MKRMKWDEVLCHLEGSRIALSRPHKRLLSLRIDSLEPFFEALSCHRQTMAPRPIH